jgi:flagellar basal body-associated protein FliL
MIVIIIIIVIIILIILSGNVTYLFVKSSEGLRVFSSTDASLNLLRRFRFRLSRDHSFATRRRKKKREMN